MRAGSAVVLLLFALAGVGWWWTATRCGGWTPAPGAPWGGRLVPRRVGGDDGRHDAAVGRPDGCSVLPHDQEPLGAAAVCSSAGISSPGRSPGRGLRLSAGVGRVQASLEWDHAGRPVAGTTLIVAAVYQLSPLKDVCLGKCRSPLGLAPRLLARRGSGRFADGSKNGAWCVGCCWALMASLFALG